MHALLFIISIPAIWMRFDPDRQLACSTVRDWIFVRSCHMRMHATSPHLSLSLSPIIYLLYIYLPHTHTNIYVGQTLSFGINDTLYAIIILLMTSEFNSRCHACRRGTELEEDSRTWQPNSHAYLQVNKPGRPSFFAWWAGSPTRLVSQPS
jgi:hypothetical protein